MRQKSSVPFLYHFFLLLTCHTIIPANTISSGTANITILIIKSCSCVAVYVTVPVSFLAVISSGLSTKYAIEFNAKSLLYPS